MNHLVIYSKKLFNKDYITPMLNGERKLGVKFRMNKAIPYGRLKDGDHLYLKESSGPIRGRVRVNQVVNKELGDPEKVMEFLSKHAEEIGITNEAQLMDVWRHHASRRYLSYWRIEEPETIKYPVFIQKTDRRAWVIGYEPSEEVAAAFL